MKGKKKSGDSEYLTRKSVYIGFWPEDLPSVFTFSTTQVDAH